MDDFIIRLRGLPFSAIEDEILDFLEGIEIPGGKCGVHLTQKCGGRPTGEAFVELINKESKDAALKLHWQRMGHRYIEVFSSTRAEMEKAICIGESGPKDKSEMILRFRGLPFDIGQRDIYKFLDDIEPSRNGVSIIVDHKGKCTGEAYVFFDSLDMLERAKTKHMEKLGHRYIEIFYTDSKDFNRATRKQYEINMRFARPGFDAYDRYNGPPDRYFDCSNHNYDSPGPIRGHLSSYTQRPKHIPYGRPGYNDPYIYDKRNEYERFDEKSTIGHVVHMRGLPFSATERDIFNFFRPLQPVKAHLIKMPSGRASGEADVDFATHGEAKQAMKKDRAPMNERYIELFMVSVSKSADFPKDFRPHINAGSYYSQRTSYYCPNQIMYEDPKKFKGSSTGSQDLFYPHRSQMKHKNSNDLRFDEKAAHYRYYDDYHRQTKPHQFGSYSTGGNSAYW